MTAFIYLVALTALSQVNARIVELSCSDNATCIDNMAKELARSVRQQKTVRLFDLFTLEPLNNRQARSNVDPLTRMLKSYAISFDWNDFTFRFSNPDDDKQTLDLEVLESRSVKEDSEKLPKKSSSKVEEEVAEDKRGQKVGLKRRTRKRKVLQAVFPMLFGMKSAGAAIFALAAVTVLTLKAFFASKVALGITVYMAMKKFYESYGNGVGLQNHPYLYSQYPIDFPSATSHAYSVSGVSSQFASPEMYSPTALAANTHTHEMLQQSDASAQQSQQAPTVLVNSTRAAERWDGYRRRPMFYGTSRATSDSYLASQKARS
ncbi:uncharacterized protein [Epargyreus clarus]|uniref:uncharacterized protein isoform X1 n=1 Tax=Epargyreus clarus TaxID=520877 RepID=UPI003C30A6C8